MEFDGLTLKNGLPKRLGWEVVNTGPKVPQMEYEEMVPAAGDDSPDFVILTVRVSKMEAAALDAERALIAARNPGIHISRSDAFRSVLARVTGVPAVTPATGGRKS